MATSAVLRYNMNKITCYLDHARVAKCSASSGFNSVGVSRLSPYYMDKNPCFPVAHGPVSLHGLYYTDSPWEEG
jgi:hypothetical protein